MLTWVLLAAGAQLITALTVLVDRYVLVSRNNAGKPIVYTFYVNLLSSFVLVLLPFGVQVPSLWLLGMSLAVAATFMSGLYLLYSALKNGNASDAVPVTGATTAVVTSIIGYFLLSKDLPLSFLPAFAFFVVGTFLISRFRLNINALGRVLLAGFFFGLSAVLLKLIFEDSDFINGFFWSRMGNVTLALGLLIIPANRHAILHSVQKSRTSTKWLIVSNKVLSGIASVMTTLAISLGSVSIVQAMVGLQFAFLVMLAYMASKLIPQIFRSEVKRDEFAHKIFGTLCIMLGLAALFIFR